MFHFRRTCRGCSQQNHDDWIGAQDRFLLHCSGWRLQGSCSCRTRRLLVPTVGRSLGQRCERPLEISSLVARRFAGVWDAWNRCMTCQAYRTEDICISAVVC